jgi:hypothetical protein
VTGNASALAGHFPKADRKIRKNRQLIRTGREQALPDESGYQLVALLRPDKRREVGPERALALLVRRPITRHQVRREVRPGRLRCDRSSGHVHQGSVSGIGEDATVFTKAVDPADRLANELREALRFRRTGDQNDVAVAKLLREPGGGPLGHGHVEAGRIQHVHYESYDEGSGGVLGEKDVGHDLGVDALGS